MRWTTLGAILKAPGEIQKRLEARNEQNAKDLVDRLLGNSGTSGAAPRKFGSKLVLPTRKED